MDHFCDSSGSDKMSSVRFCLHLISIHFAFVDICFHDMQTLKRLTPRKSSFRFEKTFRMIRYVHTDTHPVPIFISSALCTHTARTTRAFVKCVRDARTILLIYSVEWILLSFHVNIQSRQRCKHGCHFHAENPL